METFYINVKLIVYDEVNYSWVTKLLNYSRKMHTKFTQTDLKIVYLSFKCKLVLKLNELLIKLFITGIL